MSARSPRPSPILWVLLGLIAVVVVILALNHSAGTSFGLDNADFAQVASLVAILAFLAAGLLGRQLGVGQILRSTLTWAVIILVLAGLYASRDQLTGFAGRMLGALAPGLPISGRLTGDVNPDSVAIIRAGDGHFAVRADIDKAAVTLLLDTGASFLTLTQDDAWKVGINPDRLAYTVPIRTANGPMTAAAVTLDTVSIGSIERNRVRALVAPPDSLEQSLLGMSFLDTLNGYTISGDRLVLSP